MNSAAVALPTVPRGDDLSENRCLPAPPGIVEFTRRIDGTSKIGARSSTFENIFTDWKPGKESLLFFAPHDDDPAISVGLLIRKACDLGVPVRIVVVTDGRNGYVDLKDKDTIVSRRREETYASYEVLGVSRDQIVFLDFPDGGLNNFIGRRKASSGEPTDPNGFTGLENHFVTELRKRVKIGDEFIAPTRVFVPSLADYHQDHVAVAKQVPISIFHAAGGIWPECGEKLTQTPFLYWHCVYCKLPDNRKPNIRIQGDETAFNAKLLAIEAYNSQGQIAGMVVGLKRTPHVEYLHEEAFCLYEPGCYDNDFQP